MCANLWRNSETMDVVDDQPDTVGDRSVPERRSSRRSGLNAASAP
jgi:hypothetical protein